MLFFCNNQFEKNIQLFFDSIVFFLSLIFHTYKFIKVVNTLENENFIYAIFYNM